MGIAPLAEDSPAAFIFSRRQLRQRQPADSESAVGMGMTWGSSAHQQPFSCLQVIGASHWEQRVSTGRLWSGGRRTSSGCKLVSTKPGASDPIGADVAGLVALVCTVKAAAGLPHSKVRGRFSCQRAEAGAILDIRWRFAKQAGAVYFVLLQSLTGNLNS
jgi:hypothetical protein